MKRPVIIVTTAFALFPLGQVVATPGSIEATTTEHRLECLNRHVRGDWGIVDEDDARENVRAVADGNRILSAYAIDPEQPCKGYGDNTFWIITEADRSVTTFLLPNEY